MHKINELIPCIEDYNLDDFFTTAPYESIINIPDPFQRETETNRMAQQATKVGYKGFKRTLQEYIKSVKIQQKTFYTDSVTNFENQPLELDAGEWEANDSGITRNNGQFEETACSHPILPVERLTNIDTGTEKIKLAFSRGRRWREVIVDKKTIASPQSIISLADNGIAVTSENAKPLIKYLQDVEHLNYDRLPEKKSIARLGYIQDEGFSPYVDDLIFDGDVNFRPIFNAIQSEGSFQTWLDHVKEIRKGSLPARIILAASFASVLIEPLQILPFFVHLWGGDSGTGKTVALMLAASVWGKPENGRYIQTFNSTAVGRERLAAFLNHLPLLVDELQLAKDSRGQTRFSVYDLAEGVGRTRGTKTGGVEQTPTWANTIITTGESPLTSDDCTAGAINRVIDIEVQSGEKVIQDGHGTAGLLRANYGHAGRMFVEKLYENEDTILEMRGFLKYYSLTFEQSDATDKQSMAASAIILADSYATSWIFKDNAVLTPEEVAKFLASKSAASVGARGYQYILDWIAQNNNRFNADNPGDLYGVFDWSPKRNQNVAYIIGSVFNRACAEAGYNSKSLLSWLRKYDKIVTDKSRPGYTTVKRIGQNVVSCIAIVLRNDE